MTQQSIECECGCWNILLKVVPPGEPCPYCGSSEPHDWCKEKCKALGVCYVDPDASTGGGRGCGGGGGGGGGGGCGGGGQKGLNVFQFERCKQCGKLHLAGGVCPHKGTKPVNRFVCAAHQGAGAGMGASLNPKVCPVAGPGVYGPGNTACHPHGTGGWDCVPKPSCEPVPSAPSCSGSKSGLSMSGVQVIQNESFGRAPSFSVQRPSSGRRSSCGGRKGSGCGARKSSCGTPKTTCSGGRSGGCPARRGGVTTTWCSAR